MPTFKWKAKALPFNYVRQGRVTLSWTEDSKDHLDSVGAVLWHAMVLLFLQHPSFQRKETWPTVEIHTLRSVNDATEGITQESPMGASWVIPRKVDKMVWISAQFSFEENDGCFLLQVRAVTTDWEKKTMGDSWVIPTTRQLIFLSFKGHVR